MILHRKEIHGDFFFYEKSGELHVSENSGFGKMKIQKWNKEVYFMVDLMSNTIYRGSEAILRPEIWVFHLWLVK